MPFDALVTACVADELRTALVGGQIQRIVQPAAGAVALAIYAGGSLQWLLVSTDARFARVTLSPERMAKAFPTPSPVVMLLRKHLEGVRIGAVESVRDERILRFHCGPEDHRAVLVAEIMGKHSNVMLLDGEERILGAVKIIPPRQSRVRPILPGATYKPPPEQTRDEDIFEPGVRLDAALDPEELDAALRRAPAETTWRAALGGLLAGASPLLVEQILRRAGVATEQALERADVDAVVDAAIGYYTLYESREWQPTVFRDPRGRHDFAPYRPMAREDIVPMSSMTAAINDVVGGTEAHDALATTRKTVVDAVERASRAAERRSASLQRGLDASAEAETAKERGQLMLAYSWMVGPRADRLDIPELGVSISLDPGLSASENAERAFRRYAKLRDAAKRIPAMLIEAEVERERLAELAVFARLADSEGALRDIEREIRPLAGEQTVDKRKGTRAKRGPLRFRYDNGQVAILGRTAKENDEVTFRLAGRDDLWMHARERTGAHLILPGGGTLSDDVLASAAALAAYFSSGREDTRVAVDVASVRDVRKIPGAAPGKVTYRNFRTLTVRPSLSGWERSSGR